MFIGSQKNGIDLFERRFSIKNYSLLKKNGFFNLQLNLHEYNILIGIILLSSSFFIFNSIFAESSLISSSTINSTEIDTLYNKATSLYDNQRYDEAIQYYDKILAIDPSSVNALNNKGLTLDHLQRYDEAIQYYDKALTIDPSSVTTLENKAVALDHLQRYDEAIQYYDKALTIDPSNKKALNGKSSILAEIKNASWNIFSYIVTLSNPDNEYLPYYGIYPL